MKKYLKLKWVLEIEILVAVILIAKALAFTEPTVAPPAGNVAAPLNTSNSGQIKGGGLVVANAVGVNPGFLVPNGRVGIGTTDPLGILHIKPSAVSSNSFLLRGPVSLASGVSISSIGNTGTPDLPMEYRASSHIFMQGNVGIGRTDPVTPLDVHANNDNLYATRIIQSGGGGGGTSAGLYVRTQNTTSNSNDDVLRLESNSGAYTVAAFKNSGNVGIGVANPGAKLEIAGQIKITGGSPVEGRVLTTDNAGLASWVALPAAAAEADTLQTVTVRGATTDRTITLGGGRLQIRADNSVVDPGSPWFRSDGGFIVLNARPGNEMYLNWDAGGKVRTRIAFQAPQFVDENNTGYYVDPAGTSQFYYGIYNEAITLTPRPSNPPNLTNGMMWMIQ